MSFRLNNIFAVLNSGDLDMSDAQKRMIRFGQGEGKSMEDDSGWSEPVNPACRDSGRDSGPYGGSEPPSLSGGDQWFKVVRLLL